MKKLTTTITIMMVALGCINAQEKSLNITLSGEAYEAAETHFEQIQADTKIKTDWAKFYRYDEANKAITTAPSVVFMGNSITDVWAQKEPEFFTKNNFAGRGISAQTSSEMLIRFQSDVIALKPKAVVICAGTNDIACNNGIISDEHILQNIKSMCELAKLHKITPYVASILPANKFYWSPTIQPADRIIRVNEMIKSYAKANKITYIDYYSAMVDDEKGLPDNLSKDGVHPLPAGYDIMEQVLRKVIGKYFLN